MNTDTFTTPSPELKEHAQDLRDNATKVAKDLKKNATEGAQTLRHNLGQVAQDVRKQATEGAQSLRDEAGARFEDAKGSAGELFVTVKDFVSEHPFSSFGAGVIAGIILASWSRRSS